MSDVPHIRTSKIDFSKEHVDITADDGPVMEAGDDLDVGSIVPEPSDAWESDEREDDDA